MSDLITLNTYPVKNVLCRLLQDKTTDKNIIFATDNYIRYGCEDTAFSAAIFSKSLYDNYIRYGCEDTDQITENALLGFDPEHNKRH